jgi:uncharacterized protein
MEIMTTDHMRYDLLVQDALRGVVRKVLGDAGRNGLPGEHHFFVSFRTDAPGVRISAALRTRYPEEMTIVLQHQFWDLGVTEHAFEVGLSFKGVPERLLVPFDALTGFVDPSVQFGLKFEQVHAGNDDAANRPEVPVERKPSPLSAVPRNSVATLPTLKAETPKADGGRLSGEPATKRRTKGSASEPEVVTPSRPKAEKSDTRVEASREAGTPAKGNAAEKGGEGGAEVLSLDSFRKKK